MVLNLDERTFIFLLYDYCGGSRDYAARTFLRETGKEISISTTKKYWRIAGYSLNSHGGPRELRPYEEVIEAFQNTAGNFNEMATYLQVIPKQFPRLIKLCSKFKIEPKNCPKVKPKNNNHHQDLVRHKLYSNSKKPCRNLI